MSHKPKQAGEMTREAGLSDDELDHVSGGTAGAPLASEGEQAAARDAATGRASGKRQHGSFTITKEWG